MDSDSEDSIELEGPINQQQRLVHQRINFNIDNFEYIFEKEYKIALMKIKFTACELPHLSFNI